MASPIVRLPQGTYTGTVLPSSSHLPVAIEAFQGIPYAQSTAGANRFRPAVPIPPTSSETPIPAHAPGPICPVTDVQSSGSEDCLSVNVYRPSPHGASRLPVVLYVHGGAFNVGTSTDRAMESFVSFAARAGRNVIAVSCNYRLGVLGFLPAGETADKGVVNLGLRDQQFAMRWVQDNISAFGGDEGNVTAMGISAGGHSIGHHILYYEPSTAPFSKAILESGSATSRAVLYPTHARHEQQYEEFLAAANIQTPFPSNDTLPARLSALSSKPGTELAKIASKVWNAHSATLCWPFQPVIDGPGGVIPTPPLEAWLSNRGLRIPVITGFNTHEGACFIPASVPDNATFRAFFKTLIPALNESDFTLLDELYPPPETGSHFPRLEKAYAHYAYICPVLQTAHFLSEAGKPAYVYEFAARDDSGFALHTAETPYVVHDMDGLPSAAGAVQVADAMNAFFAGFAAETPDGGDLVFGEYRWPRFVSPLGEGRGEGSILVFGDGVVEGVAGGKDVVRVRTLSDLEVRQCAFWWERVKYSQGMGVRE